MPAAIPEDSPLVTVVVPTFGRPRYLVDAILSVDRQSYGNVELIVVDDASDPPVDVPAPSVECTVIRHRRNMGPGAARNTGLAHARGEFLLFLDDDDLLTANRIEIGVNEIGDRRSHAMAVELFFEDGSAHIHHEKFFDGDMRETFNWFPHPTMGQVLHRTEDVVQFDPTLRVSQDTEWWLRMSHAADFAWSPGVGQRVRRHPTARPGVQSSSRFHTRQEIYRRHAPTSDRRTRARLRGGVAAAALKAGYRPATARWSLAALCTWPTVLDLKRLGLSLAPRSARRARLEAHVQPSP